MKPEPSESELVELVVHRAAGLSAAALIAGVILTVATVVVLFSGQSTAWVVAAASSVGVTTSVYRYLAGPLGALYTHRNKAREATQ